QLVRGLTALGREEPLRERLRSQLMLALYRSGRQVEALGVYREGRRLLVEELGVEPSRPLQALERAILRQDPSLDGEAVRSGSARRGCVICAGGVPLTLVEALDRELLVVELVPHAGSLPAAARRLERLRAERPDVRTASFTTQDPGSDLARLAREQAAELLIVDRVTPELLATAPCDVALISEPAAFEARGAVLVPFGGGREEWPALEL